MAVRERQLLCDGDHIRQPLNLRVYGDVVIGTWLEERPVWLQSPAHVQDFQTSIRDTLQAADLHQPYPQGRQGQRFHLAQLGLGKTADKQIKIFLFP